MIAFAIISALAGLILLAVAIYDHLFDAAAPGEPMEDNQ